jgi:hypothetical protein
MSVRQREATAVQWSDSDRVPYERERPEKKVQAEREGHQLGTVNGTGRSFSAFFLRKALNLARPWAFAQSLSDFRLRVGGCHTRRYGRAIRKGGKQAKRDAGGSAVP